LKEKEKPPRSYFLYKTYILQPHLFKLERGWPFLYTSPLTLLGGDMVQDGFKKCFLQNVEKMLLLLFPLKPRVGTCPI